MKPIINLRKIFNSNQISLLYTLEIYSFKQLIEKMKSNEWYKFKSISRTRTREYLFKRINMLLEDNYYSFPEEFRLEFYKYIILYSFNKTEEELIQQFKKENNILIPNIIKNLIKILIKDGDIIKEENSQKLYATLKSFKYLNMTKKETETLKEYLSGKNINQIAKEKGKSRQSISLMLISILKKTPCIYLDKYKSIFIKYNIQIKEFMEIFQENEESYFYLKIKYKYKHERQKSIYFVKKKNILQQIIKDKKIDFKEREKIEQYLNKKYCFVDKSTNKNIKKNFTSINQFLLKKYCSNNSMKIKKYFNLFKKYLYLNKLEEKINMPIDITEHAFEARLNHQKNTLMFFPKSVKYFDMSNFDINKFLEEINIQKYNNKIISLDLIYDNNLNLMKKYKINNKYELHNLIIYNLKKIKIISIKRMRNPYICIGKDKISIQNQIREFKRELLKNNPELLNIKNKQLPCTYFVKLYTEEYGGNKSSLLSNFAKFFTEE